jgi:hypothetical protein
MDRPGGYCGFVPSRSGVPIVGDDRPMLSRRRTFWTGRCENGAPAGASNLLYYVLRSFEDPAVAIDKYSTA